jgi:two-component system nitrate/nitrite response regulator NarL
MNHAAGSIIAPGPIRVIVADDHARYGRLIAATLEEAGITVAAVAVTGEEAIEAIRRELPLVAIVDMRMPLLSGADVASAARRDAPRTRVVILSAFADPEIVTNAIEAGAFGYITKDSTPEAIVEAVGRCANGTPSLPAALPAALRRDLARKALRST